MPEITAQGDVGTAIRARKLTKALGWYAETFPVPVGNSALTTQVINYSTAYLFAGEIATNIIVIVQTAGAGVVPTGLKLGLFDDSATPKCVALTADTAADAMWTTNGFKAVPLSSPYTIPADGLFRPVIWEAGAFGTTALKLVAASGASATQIVGGGGGSSAIANPPSGALGSAPATLAVNDTGAKFSNAGLAVWFGIS